jgi:hypothetical protein
MRMILYKTLTALESDELKHEEARKHEAREESLFLF